MHYRAWTGIVAAVCTGLSAQGAVGIRNLGGIPNQSFVNGLALSGDGSTIVGDIQIGHYSAFRWTSASGVQNLGVVGSSLASHAYSVSYDGSVVVGGLDDGPIRAFKWTSSTGMQDLGPTPGTGIGPIRAWGVSSDGTAAAGHSFLWRDGSPVQTISILPYGNDFRGISGNGQYLLGTQYDGSGSHAFRWSSGSGAESLGRLPFSANAVAKAASFDGNTVIGTGDTFGYDHGFRWTIAGGIQDLGLLANGYDSTAAAVSADGMMVVGTCRVRTPSLQSRATLWTPSTGLVDLNTYLPSLGINLTGWNLGSAFGISADGTVIAGMGSSPNGGGIWIATIPSPSVGTVLATGGLFFGRRRQRGRSSCQK